MDTDTANGWIAAHFAGWVRALEPRVERIACTGAIVALPVTPAITGPGGIVAPQALATLADLAMIIACAGYFREYRPVAASTFDLQALQPAKGDSISCTATVMRGGKALIFTRAMLTAEPSGKDVAAATAAYPVL